MHYIWLLLLLLTAFPLWSEDSPTGTLVVSYQTGAKGERLDRVRFRLINEQKEQQTYPKGNDFVFDDNCLNRTVVIENLPIGNYSLEFIIPNFDALFETVHKRQIEITSDDIVRVDQLIRPRYASLKAAAVIAPNAPPFVVLPTITVEDHQKQMHAQSTLGKLAVHYLIPGSYKIIFEPLPGYITPEPIPVQLAPYENAGPFIGSYESPLLQPENEGFPSGNCHINTCFLFKHLLFPPLGASDNVTIEDEMGFVNVKSNLPDSGWSIYRGNFRLYSGKGSETKIPLPRGNRYRLQTSDIEGYSYQINPPTYFAIGPGETTLVEVNYEKAFGELEIETLTPEVNRVEITIKTSMDISTTYTLVPVNGKINWSKTLPVGEYTIYFSSSPPSNPPPPQHIKITSNRHLLISPFFATAKEFKTDEVSVPSIKHTFLTVTAGPAIVGDPFKEGKADETPSRIIQVPTFLIDAFEVTNMQYAAWLTKAFQNANVFYDHGIVTDAQGRLLCKTAEAETYSQIMTRSQTENGMIFLATPGKEFHPVINVTWFGASAYCVDHNYRLPTEAEWEKAAGMDISHSVETLRKFRYGFSRDVINRTWANYKFNDNPITKYQVLTTPVGFYNGINILPPNANESHPVKTNLARSPVGAYDMSGNVWEWVADWYQSNYDGNDPTLDFKGPSVGSTKVVKGGCYDSLAKGVRVAERLSLSPEHADPYTGFRVAKQPDENNADQ